MYEQANDLPDCDYFETPGTIAMLPPDEIFDGDGAAPKKHTGNITIETKELCHIMDVIGAVHGVLKEDRPFSALERSYDTYTLYCEGNPAPRLAEKNKRDMGVKVRRLLRAVDETRPVIKKLGFHKSLQKKWNSLTTAAQSVSENLDKYLES